jgi:hypothetical protein
MRRHGFLTLTFAPRAPTRACETSRAECSRRAAASPAAHCGSCVSVLSRPAPLVGKTATFFDDALVYVS